MSESFEAQLAREVAAWRRDGIVDVRSAQRILQRYKLGSPEIDREVATAARGRSATIIGTFGAILLGLGTILFVASNWAQLDRGTRVVLLVAALLASAVLAFALRRSRHQRTGAALVFVNALVFGANVFFVGQTYHVRIGDPLIYLVWAMGVLPMAVVTSSRPSFFLGLCALVAWYGSLTADWGAFRFWPDPLVAPAFIGVGVLLAASARLAQRIGRGSSLTLVTAISGATLGLLVIFILTFETVWREMGTSVLSRPSDAVAPEFRWSVAIVIAASILVAIAAAWRAAWSRAALIEAGALIGLQALILLVIVLHPLQGALQYAVLFDLIALGVIAWAIQVGLATGREAFINLGVVLFGLLVLARYFDFFGTLFDRSLAFMGAGILLIAGGFLLDRSRRLLVDRARASMVVARAS